MQKSINLANRILYAKTTVDIHQNLNNPQIISDQDLYKLCKDYGKQARKWSREFGFLLPEVYRRGLHRKYGCTSINMFAAKLAGMSHETTNRILNLSTKLADKPLLWSEFRTYGWSKLRVIAEISKHETQSFWIDKLRRMPKAVLEEYVRKYKEVRSIGSTIEKNDIFSFLKSSVPFAKEQASNFSINKPESAGAPKLGDEKNKSETIVLPQEIEQNSRLTNYRKLKFNVDVETEFLFKEFKQKLEKEQKTTLTMGETLKELLKPTRESKIQTEASVNVGKMESTTKAEPANDSDQYNKESLNSKTSKPTTDKSHQTPSKIKKHIIKKYNNKCAFPGCNNAYFELHHADRFSITKQHSRIYPLCKLHHKAAHSSMIENEDQPIENWRFNLNTGNPLRDFDGTTESNILRLESNEKDQENRILNFQQSNVQFEQAKLDHIFQLYERLEKERIDARVRSHWT